MANPAPTINQINAFNATQGTTIDFNIIGGTELIRSNRIYIYDLSDNSLICTHLYVSTESIHELPANTDGSIVYESGKSSADFVNGAQYYAQIQTYTDTNGTQGGSGLSVAKMFWCLGDPTLTITTIPSTISTTSYNISATYTDTSASVVSNIIQQYQFNLYSATGSLLQSSGVVVGSGMQQGTSAIYDISYNFTGLNVGSSYYVTVDVTTTQGMSVNAQSNTFTVSIDTPTLGEATVVNNACDGYISVTSNLSGEYGGSGSGEIVSFETDSENVFSKLQVDLEPTQEGSGDPSPSNVRPIRGHSEVDVNVVRKNLMPKTNSSSRTANGITLDYDGEVYHIYGTNTKTDANYAIGGNFIEKLTGLEPNVVYTLSTTTPLPSGLYLGINTRNSSGTGIEAGANSYLFGDGSKTSNTFTCTQDTNGTLIFFCGVRDNCGTVDVTFKIQLEEGSTATPYEPYQQPQTITQDFNVSLTPTSTDTTPYLFKAVGDVYGDRLEDKIVGGTVAWNQMCNATNFVSSDYCINNNDGTITVKSGATEYFKVNGDVWTRFVAGHKYLALLGGFTSTANLYLRVDGEDGNAWISTVRGSLFTTSVTFEKVIYLRAYEYTGEDVTVTPQIFDLTQMFGSTIADYIYSLEQSQAGAGVAWFKKLFPKDYYAYNAGELLSVEGLQSHNTVGFNQANPNTYIIGTNSHYNASIGDVLSTGGSSDRATASGENPIAVAVKTAWAGVTFVSDELVAGYQYELKANTSAPTSANVRVSAYLVDKDYTIVGTLGNQISASTYIATATPQDSGLRLALYIGSYSVQNVTVEEYCVHLVWDGERNGEYEPYEKHSYPLDSSLTLRGIPKLDASNNLYYDGDEYTSDGKVKRKYGAYTIQASNVSLNNNAYTNISYAEIVNLPNMLKSLDKQCVHSKFGVGKRGYPFDDAGLVGKLLINSSVDRFWFGFAKGTTEEQMKSALDGTTIVYELATPTTETATPYTNPQIVSKYGTLEYVTNSIVPVGHKTTYLTRDIFGGYVDLISGKLVVDRVSVDLGSLDYILSATNRFYATLPSPAKPTGSYNVVSDCLCDVYAPKTQNQVFAGVIGIAPQATVGTTVYIYDSAYATADAIKSGLQGRMFCYELATPQTYQLTPQQVSTLVGTNNVWSEQGNIELSYHIPITNLLVKRQDVDDVSGGWLTLYSQPISQASDMDFTFIDFLNQYGKTYKYALVPLLTQTQSGVEVEVEGGYTVSDEVQSVFDGVFIADSTGSQKCKANVGYGNVDMNQVVGSITPIGAKYPIIITNSHNQYHNGSISGTIVPDDYYFNGNLSRIDMVNKRNELEQFLTNKRVKVIKDWNGNIWLVMIAGNVSCTFNNDYGMGIVSFNTNWTEVGDPTNQQDLQATGLINVGGV